MKSLSKWKLTLVFLGASSLTAWGQVETANLDTGGGQQRSQLGLPFLLVA